MRCKNPASGEVFDAIRSGNVFDINKFRTEALNFSKSWQNKNNTYSSEPKGNTSTIAKELYEKYKRI